MNEETCRWDQWDPLDYGSTWETACGQSWCLESGTLAENGVRFCFHCGKPTEFHVYIDDEETE